MASESVERPEDIARPGVERFELEGREGDDSHAPRQEVNRSSHVIRRARRSEERMGDALGWLSVGLGLMALLAPRMTGRATGLGEHTALLRGVGARELMSGAGLLTQRNRTPWLWSRVAGDAMDLALIGPALRKDNPGRGRAFGTLIVVGAIAAMDFSVSLRQTRKERGGHYAASGGHEAFLEHSLVVSKTSLECYSYWRDAANLPRFMRMVRSVTAVDDCRTHWVVGGPGGTTLEWNSELVVDRPGERLSWHSVEGSSVIHAGTVRFEAAPGGLGTIVRVLIHYRPPLGRASVGIAKLLGRDPNAEVREDLRRFKQVIETGEIATTRGQSSGRRSFLGRLTPDGRNSREGKPA